jgi:predicted chitinase
VGQPWDWEGYDMIYSEGAPRSFRASSLRVEGLFNEKELERFAHLADIGDQERVLQRLYDIIDRNRDGKLTADEVQAAMRLPAKAQAIAQMVVSMPSEWHYEKMQWDDLDELLGHTSSTPNVNWISEKGRIKELSWWPEVAGRVGLPGSGRVTHFHPVGLCALFSRKRRVIDVESFLALYEREHILFAAGTPKLNQKSVENLRSLLFYLNAYYENYSEVVGLHELSYMLATVRHEAYNFKEAEFFSSRPESGSFSYFDKYDPVLAADENQRVRARNYGNTEKGDGYKYRGRGLVHITWKVNYQKFSDILGVDLVGNPHLAAELRYSVPIMMIGMIRGSFTGRKLSHYFDEGKKDYRGARKIINRMNESELIASYAERFGSILSKVATL